MSNSISSTEKVMHEIIALLRDVNVKGIVFLDIIRHSYSENFHFSVSPAAGIILIHSTGNRKYIKNENNLSYLLTHNLKETDLESLIEPMQKLLQQLKISKEEPSVIVDEWFFSLDITSNKFEELDIENFITQLSDGQL